MNASSAQNIVDGEKEREREMKMKKKENFLNGIVRSFVR